MQKCKSFGTIFPNRKSLLQYAEHFFPCDSIILEHMKELLVVRML